MQVAILLAPLAVLPVLLVPSASLAGVAVAALVHAGIALVVRARAPVSHPYARFGTANAISMLRGAGAAAFAGLAVQPAALTAPALWMATASAVVLLALDGLDGMVARREGLASDFGARLDMEVDALFILVLSALAFGLGKAGVWVLGLGLMRYGFLAAGLAIPALARPLPVSIRRKAACVVQVAVLAALVAPPVVPPVSTGLAALAFAALGWSFAIDVRWLWARRAATGRT